MHRIYFDLHEGPGDFPGDRRYTLWLSNSLKDIAPIASELRDGLRVVIYMTGELEMEAVLEFDPKHGTWMAHGDFATIIHYDVPGA